MSPRSSTAALLALLLALAAFVALTARALPAVVATHFDVSGAANGFMRHGTYVTLMLVLVVGLPLVVAFVTAAAADRGGANLAIPHRDHWLAPERRAGALAYLRGHAQSFAALLALLLAYVHWLVVRANELQPATLSIAGLAAGLAVFFVLMAVWLGALFARFRRPG
jgi:uncharacterized membrane protein